MLQLLSLKLRQPANIHGQETEEDTPTATDDGPKCVTEDQKNKREQVDRWMAVIRRVRVIFVLLPLIKFTEDPEASEDEPDQQEGAEKTFDTLAAAIES